MIMHLKNEDDTRKAIAEWQNFSVTAQAANLRKAIDIMELDQMYYDQKGSERGMERCDTCLKMLRERLAEVSV
jgi:hypothetical protein